MKIETIECSIRLGYRCADCRRLFARYPDSVSPWRAVRSEADERRCWLCVAFRGHEDDVGFAREWVLWNGGPGLMEQLRYKAASWWFGYSTNATLAMHLSPRYAPFRRGIERRLVRAMKAHEHVLDAIWNPTTRRIVARAVAAIARDVWESVAAEEYEVDRLAHADGHRDKLPSLDALRIREQNEPLPNQREHADRYSWRIAFGRQARQFLAPYAAAWEQAVGCAFP